MALTEGQDFTQAPQPFVQYELGELGPGIHSAPRVWVARGSSNGCQVEHAGRRLETLGPCQQLFGKAKASARYVNLFQRTEDQLLEVRNFGETTLNEVKDKLFSQGLRLGMRVSSNPVR